MNRSSRQRMNKIWMSRVAYASTLCCAGMCGQSSAGSQCTGRWNTRCMQHACACLLKFAGCQQRVSVMHDMQRVRRARTTRRETIENCIQIFATSQQFLSTSTVPYVEALPPTQQRPGRKGTIVTVPQASGTSTTTVYAGAECEESHCGLSLKHLSRAQLCIRPTDTCKDHCEF